MKIKDLKLKITKGFLLKVVLPIVLAICCIGVVLIVNKSGGNTSGKHEVLFEEGDGYTFVTETENGAYLKYGTEVSFSIDVSVFYTNTPVVSVNGKAIPADANGQYKFEVTGKTEVTVDGVEKEIANLVGIGTTDSPFQISRPIDLLYIAEQVNKGNYSYVTGTYVLLNDIDCNGEELEIIGDLRTDAAYFAGFVTCDNDSTIFTENRRPKIKNFVINSDNVNYVGLFGAVMKDVSVANSAAFHGIVLEDFTINVSLTDPKQADNLSIACGGMIGYGIGAFTRNCDVVDGTINVYADDSYFSFVGGMIGYHQSVYMQEFDQFLNAEVSNAKVDVDINVFKGSVLAAGGITGLMATDNAYVPGFIVNSYATGDIHGAIRAGGIVGSLGQYCSVSNSYATGQMVAKSNQLMTASLDKQYHQYCVAAAGGLVGYAENDTIIHDSFATGKTYAKAISGEKYEYANSLVGYGDKAGTASAAAQKFVIFNCMDTVSGNEHTDFNLSDSSSLTSVLGWLDDYIWTLEDGAYPVINYNEATPVRATITEYYVAKDEAGAFEKEVFVKEKSSKVSTYLDPSSGSSYLFAPLGGVFVTGDLPFYYASDDGLVSYGYYLDEACTIKMPNGYTPIKDVFLYVPFTDLTPVLGNYVVETENGKAVNLNFYLDPDSNLGTIEYTDGNRTDTSLFSYDGEYVYVHTTRLTRYFNGPVETEEDETATILFDSARYYYYDFKGLVKEDGTIELFDETYFTSDEPLIAVKDGYVANNYDNFKGSWVKSATINKVYTFDGMGNWTYAYTAYDRSNPYNIVHTVLDRASGTYSGSGNDITLSNGDTVSIDSDGFMQVTSNGVTQTYYREGSFKGTWMSGDTKLTLNGIKQDGYGSGQLYYDELTHFDFIYENSESDGFVVLYDTSYNLFGYYTYEFSSNMLLAMLYDPASAEGFTQFNLSAIDDFYGDWISNDETLHSIEFNGKGFYDSPYAAFKGSLTINDEKVSYTLDSSTLTGSFIYKNRFYTMTYDEVSNMVYIECEGVTTELQRKDVYANKVFIDNAGNSFKFDGKGNLVNGGKITFNDKSYTYKNTDDGFIVYDNNVSVGSGSSDGKLLNLNLDGTSYSLYVQNKWMGTWAISGEYDSFEIGPSTLDNNMFITYEGVKVEMSYLNSTTFTFNHKASGSSQVFTYYLHIREDNGEESLILSLSESLLGGSYSICSRANTLFGEWTLNKLKNRTIVFDGITSPYTNGQAKVKLDAAETLFFYVVRDEGILMWSQEMQMGKTIYYKIEFTDNVEDRNAYRQGDRAFLWLEVDALFMTKAKDADGVTYSFDGGNVEETLGTVTTDNGKSYSYKITAFNANSTANLTLTDKETGKTYTAILDYSDNNNNTITLVEDSE